MLSDKFRYNENKLLSLFFISSLTISLFYTGINTWLFTASYAFIIFGFTLVLKQRFYLSINISINGILVSSVLLLSWFAISIFTSQIKYLTIYNLFWVGSLLIIFLLFSIADKKDQVWSFIWPAILLLVTAWAIYGLFQYYYLHVPSNATFLNRNSLAALINLALIPAAGYFLLNENERPWKKLNNKLLSSVLIILFLTVFIITSRGASLSLAFGFLLLLTLLRKHVEKPQIYTLFIIIFISFLVANLSQYFIPSLPEGFTERMMSLTNTSEAGNSRYIIWNSLIPLFQEMPWYGFGLGSLWLFWPPHRPANDTSAGFFAHNDYMQMTLEAGYPGILLLLLLFGFVIYGFIRALKNNTHLNELTLLQRVELVSMFSALTTFAAHSFFTYNFYVLPLLIIAGFYLARINQLITLNTHHFKTIPALKLYFKPFIFLFCSVGLVFILASYFLSISFSNFYNVQAKKLMQQQKYQDANTLFLKAQSIAPLMDNPFFSHADLLRRGANTLIGVNKNDLANSLLKNAHTNLDKAEKLNPLRPQTHHIRALIYENDQPEKAFAEYSSALKLDPRFLFSRINLAKLLHKNNQLKQALEVLYQGINYNYPIDQAMLQYMKLFAKLSREAGAESFAIHLESNINKFKIQNAKNH